MSNDKLRQKIATKLGWHVTWWFNHYAWQVTYKGESIDHGKDVKSYEEAWEKGAKAANIPNWPEDPTAALELCQQLGMGKSREWWLVIRPDAFTPWYTACFVDYDWQQEGRWEVIHQYNNKDLEGEGETLAIALSELALLTLEMDKPK